MPNDVRRNDRPKASSPRRKPGSSAPTEARVAISRVAESRFDGSSLANVCFWRLAAAPDLTRTVNRQPAHAGMPNGVRWNDRPKASSPRRKPGSSAPTEAHAAISRIAESGFDGSALISASSVRRQPPAPPHSLQSWQSAYATMTTGTSANSDPQQKTMHHNCN